MCRSTRLSCAQCTDGSAAQGKRRSVCRRGESRIAFFSRESREAHNHSWSFPGRFGRSPRLRGSNDTTHGTERRRIRIGSLQRQPARRGAAALRCACLHAQAGQGHTPRLHDTGERRALLYGGGGVELESPLATLGGHPHPLAVRLGAAVDHVQRRDEVLRTGGVGRRSGQRASEPTEGQDKTTRQLHSEQPFRVPSSTPPCARPGRRGWR